MPTITLPRFPTNWQEQPYLVARYWDEAMLELEKTLNTVLALPAIQEALEEVSAAIDNTNEAIGNLEEAAASVTEEQSLVSSYVDLTSFAGDLITATTTGDITVATHDRIYGSTSNPTVEVTGDTFSSGASTGDVVRVYYIDTLKTGGAVTYLFTIDPAAPVAQGDGAHSVGAVSIPATGVSIGKGVSPPGYVEQ